MDLTTAQDIALALYAAFISGVLYARHRFNRR